MKLYEIAEEYQNFLDAVEAGEIPEEALADTLESISSLLEDKADNIACLIKNMTAEAAAIKAEEDKLAERRKTKERRIEGLKKYLSFALQQSGKTKIETARNNISFRKTPPKLIVEDEAAFKIWASTEKPEFLTFKDPDINKNAVKSAIAAGVEIRGAHLESGVSMTIR